MKKRTIQVLTRNIKKAYVTTMMVVMMAGATSNVTYAANIIYQAHVA